MQTRRGWTMGERSGGGQNRSAGGVRAWTGLLRRLVMVAVLGLAIAGAQARVSAQTAAPTVEESPDEATILLLPHLFADADAPAGYSLTSTAAHPLEADAFDAVMVPPADPRPMDTLLTRLVDAGQIVRLRQDFEPDADADDNSDDDRPELGFTVVAFGSTRS